MTQTTSFLALTKPGGGSTGLNTPPDRVDIDVLNDNFQKIDDWAALIGNRGNRIFDFRGTAGALSSLTGMVRGDTYRETDGSFLKWEYDGSNWVSGQSGVYLLRPVTVTNGATAADGTVNPSAAQTSISLNGVFTTRFRKYRIEFYVDMTGAANIIFRFRNAGADNSANSYIFNTAEVTGTTMTVTAQTLTQLFLNYGSAPNDTHFGTIEISNPAHTGLMKTFEARVGSARVGSPGFNSRVGRHEGADALTFDGFSIFSGGAPTFETQSWFKVYGLT